MKLLLLYSTEEKSHTMYTMIWRFYCCLPTFPRKSLFFEILELSSFTHNRDELQISQSFSQRKMACVIGKKTHLGSPAALWWKVRSQPKQSQRLSLAHHLETQSSNKQGSTIAVYLCNDQSHHDKGLEKKKLIYESNYSKNTFFQEVRGCESGPSLW